LDEFTEGEAETVTYDNAADKITLTGRSELRTYQGTRLSDRVQGHLIVFNNISEVFTVDPQPKGTSAGPARIKAMLTPRNNGTEEASGNTLVPSLRISPRVTAPGAKP